jgi:hypothetical protein
MMIQTFLDVYTLGLEKSEAKIAIGRGAR